MSQAGLSLFTFTTYIADRETRGNGGDKGKHEISATCARAPCQPKWYDFSGGTFYVILCSSTEYLTSVMNMGPMRKWNQITPVAIIALVGVILSVAAFLLVGDLERQGVRAQFERSANDRIAALKSEINTNLEIVHSLKSLFLATRKVGRSEFRSFVAHFLARHKTIQALEWIPRVPAAKRSEYEAAVRKAGYPDFQFTERKVQGQMVPAALREEYFPVYFVEPFAGNQKAFGFDLGSEPTRVEALRKARDTGKAVATGRITLVQETEQQYGFLVFLPVYGTDLGNAPLNVRREGLAGFALGVFRLKDIVQRSIARAGAGKSEFEVFLFDRAAPPEKQLLYPKQDKITSVGHLGNRKIHAASIDVGGRDWLVVIAQTPGAYSAETLWEPIAVLVLGLLFSTLLSAYLHKILSQRGQIERTVNERTAELTNVLAKLSDVNTTLRDSEARQAGILTSAADGIISIDEFGKIESFNPAAESTFGYSAQEVLGRNISMLMPSPYREEHDRYLASYLNTGEKKIIGIGRQVTGLRKNGQEFPMDLSVNEMYLAGKRLFTGVVRDLTDRIEVERALEQSEGALVQLREKQVLSELQASWNARIEAYRDFIHTVGNLITPAKIKASTLAHDDLCMNYLDQLRSRVEVFMDKLNNRELESYLSEDGKRDLPQFVRGLEILEEYYGQINKGLLAIETALTRVIETTNSQSRLQKTIADTVEVDMVAAIEGVLTLLDDNWKQKGISKTFSATDEDGTTLREIVVRADKVRLFNMIHNVLKNAGEAFAGSNGNNRQIKIQLLLQHNRISLEVVDNGHGLNEEELARIGQIGFTTKQSSAGGEGGSGMGIHNCQIFMAGIGGRFDLTSEGPGKGAKATAIFPAQVKA